MATDLSETEQRARALFAQGDYAAAEFLFQQLALATPDDAVAHYNLGVCAAKLEQFEDALACYRRAIELNPAFADAYTNFGVCLNALNLIPQARQAFALARKLAPDNPIPVLNEGIAALALGDYETGWQDFAARWELPAYAKFKRAFPQPLWNGENLNGKTLFLYAEQGFGDSIMMARYAPLLAAQGAKIIIEAPPALKRLLQTLPGSPMIIAKGEPVPAFDFYCAMMDIPGIVGTTLETIPQNAPYLFPDNTQGSRHPGASRDPAPRVHAARVLDVEGLTQMDPRLRGDDAPQKRIGLCWAGRSTHENDPNRSLAFAQFAPLLKNRDIEWVSLQRHIPERDAADFMASGILNWGASFTDFSTAAAAMMSCDLVITVDTSIAHLAGALGKKTFILLPFYADWRWLTARSDSPWYPTARLFRQKQRGDWGGVINQISEAVSALYIASI